MWGSWPPHPEESCEAVYCPGSVCLGAAVWLSLTRLLLGHEWMISLGSGPWGLSPALAGWGPLHMMSSSSLQSLDLRDPFLAESIRWWHLLHMRGCAMNPWMWRKLCGWVESLGQARKAPTFLSTLVICQAPSWRGAERPGTQTQASAFCCSAVHALSVSH